MAPVMYSKLSARAVFPLPLWPSRQMLRIELTVYIVVKYSFREDSASVRLCLGAWHRNTDIIHERSGDCNSFFVKMQNRVIPAKDT